MKKMIALETNKLFKSTSYRLNPKHYFLLVITPIHETLLEENDSIDFVIKNNSNKSELVISFLTTFFEKDMLCAA